MQAFNNDINDDDFFYPQTQLAKMHSFLDQAEQETTASDILMDSPIIIAEPKVLPRRLFHNLGKDNDHVKLFSQDSFEFLSSTAIGSDSSKETGQFLDSNGSQILQRPRY